MQRARRIDTRVVLVVVRRKEENKRDNKGNKSRNEGKKRGY